MTNTPFSMKMECMDYIIRTIEPLILETLKRGKSILLLGARQTGKTTLINRIILDLSISFIQPAIRQKYEQNPSVLTSEIEALAEEKKSIPLVVIDEVQKIPEILDVVQDLIDRNIAKFILTGSSARKLRTGKKINLLPGRVVVLKLDPLSYVELKKEKFDINDFLLYGDLPGILKVDNNENRELDLKSYVVTYLEEEIRAEALVRNVGHFSRFLNLAGSESGNILNFRKLSQEIGIAHTTIASYYQILEDCLIIERIEPFIQTKNRRKLIKTPKYLFFDLGIRRVAAEEGTKLPYEYTGRLFEQYIGLELIRNARFHNNVKIQFWRDPSGPEVDWILIKENKMIPIEVKWTNKPSMHDIKYLKLFMDEYDVPIAYLICQIPRRMKMADNIYAIPWEEFDSIFLEID